MFQPVGIYVNLTGVLRPIVGGTGDALLGS